MSGLTTTSGGGGGQRLGVTPTTQPRTTSVTPTAQRTAQPAPPGASGWRGDTATVQQQQPPTTFPFGMPPPPPPGPPVPPPAPLTIQGQSDPAMRDFLDSLRGRLSGLQGHENDPVSWSAERASDLAARDIYGGAAGAKKRKLEELSERGLSGGRGVGEGQLRSIDEAAATRSAKATSDIGLAREREQDSLNLQRQGAVNSLYGALGNFAQVPFQQTLQSGNQALNAWQAGDNSTLERARLQQSQQQSQLQNWLSLMRGLS